MPDDVAIYQGAGTGGWLYSAGWWDRPRDFTGQRTFSSFGHRRFGSEEQALEYVEGLGNPEPIYTLPVVNSGGDREPLFTGSWREAVDGIFIDRRVELFYTGDEVELYTINDLVNFLALFFEVTPEEILDESYYTDRDGQTTLDNAPSLDCETYIKATITQDYFPAGPIEVDIDFTGSSIPATTDVDITITHVGNPVVPTTLLENGDGSLVISDNGNINMSNDGGSFYLMSSDIQACMRMEM